MRTSIYLIRHAQSHPSVRLRDAEWPLSRLGKDQAQTLSRLLIPLGIKRLFSSPYVRCLETIRPFATRTRMDVVTQHDLRERLVAEGIVDGFVEIWRKSWADFDYAVPGCESSRDAQFRFVAAVKNVLRECTEDTIAICAHGGVIGLFLNRVDPGFGLSETNQLTNPDVLRIVATDGRFDWDRDFVLPGLREMATDHLDTPIDRQM